MSPTKRTFHPREIATLLLAIGLLLPACSANTPPVTTPVPAPQTSLVNDPGTAAGPLTPYVSPTQTASAAAAVPTSTASPAPSPSPTLRTHVVKKGEDLGGIAWQYRVSLEALMAANPTIQPYAMSVGTTLLIPASKTPLPPGSTPASAGAEAATPTAIPMDAGPLSCTQVEDGGIWCFQPVLNPQSFTLEGLSATFRLAAPQGQQALVQGAFLPLDTLAPGASLPLAAYFPPEQVAQAAPPYQFTSTIVSALPSANNGRYLNTHVENSKVLLAENGLSAEISAEVILEASEKAGRVWVAAVAYDTQGNVVGVRRWEAPSNQNARPLEHGQALSFKMSLYSVSKKIERVELISEARP